MKASGCKGKLAGVALALSILGFLPQPSEAAVILNGCAGGSFGAACGLDELLNGGSINIDGTLFSNFTFTDLGGSKVLNAGLVRVDSINTSLNPGLTLVATNGAMSVSNGDSILSNLGFNVSVVSGNVRI